MAKTSMKLILPPALGSYVNLFDAKQVNGQGEPKFSIALLWPKNDPIICIDSDTKEKVKLSDAIAKVAVAAFGPTAPALLQKGKLKGLPRDGDERDEDEVYAGMQFLNASSTRAPGVVDARAVSFQKLAETAALTGEEFDPREEAYSGCYFRASVALFPYDKAGNKGVGIGLNNVQVVKKGKRIDGRKSAEAEFGDFAEEGAASSEADDLVG